MEETTSQRAAILADLEAGEVITSLDAVKRYGCLRLAARINDLREDGYDVITEIVQAGRKRYARYSLNLPTQPSLF